MWRRHLSSTLKTARTLLAVVSAALAQGSCKHYGGFEPLTKEDLKPGKRFSLSYSASVFPKDFVFAEKLKGPFLLEFYFYGCRACWENMDSFHEVASIVKDEATVIEMSLDCEKDLLSSWAKLSNAKWPVVSTCDTDVVDELSVSRFPTTLVLDKEWQVVLRHVGVWSSESKEKILRTLRRESR